MTRRCEFGWAVVLPALVVPLFGSLVYFVWMPDGAVGKAAYGATKLFTLLYPLIFLQRIGKYGLTRREEGKEKGPGWKVVVGTGLLSGLAIAALGTALMLTPLGEIVRSGAGRITTRAEGLGFLEHYVVFAIFISVLHSLLEEYYWRWFTYGQLRNICGRWTAHGIAALGFAAHHLVITLQFFPAPLAVFLAAGVAVGGLIWTLMYEWQGTVVGCWVSHFVVDVFIMAVGYQLIMG